MSSETESFYLTRSQDTRVCRSTEVKENLTVTFTFFFLTGVIFKVCLGSVISVTEIEFEVNRFWVGLEK